MTPGRLREVESELESFVEGLFMGFGRRERREALEDYTRGLLLDGERKSMEPMARRLCAEEAEVDACRQRLQEAIGRSRWDERVLLSQLACLMEAALPGVEALGLDDTDLLKRGHHSVGVAHQYAGSIGSVANCQVLVGLHLLAKRASCPLSLRLYLPREWTDSPERREEAGIPEEVGFEEKWRIGLHLLEQARGFGVRCRMVVADAGYGDVLEFRRALRRQGYAYALGIKGSLVFWAAEGKLTPDVPLSAEELARSLPARAFKRVRWREGSKGPLQSRFCALRVKAAPDWTKGAWPEEEEWLVVEWPKGEAAPVHYWVLNAPATTPLEQLVHLCTLRWRVEQDYEQLKGELGLSHYEGRSWQGLHHHAAMCIVAYAFLALQRAFPPLQGRHLEPARSATPPAAGADAAAGPLPHLPQAPVLS